MKLFSDIYEAPLVQAGRELKSGEAIVWTGGGGIGLQNLGFGILCLLVAPVLTIATDLVTANAITLIAITMFALWHIFSPVKPIFTSCVITNQRVLVFRNIPSITPQKTKEYDLRDFHAPRVAHNPIFNDLGNLTFDRVLPWKPSVWLMLNSYPHLGDLKGLRFYDIPEPSQVAELITRSMIAPRKAVP